LGKYRLELTLPMYRIHGTDIPWGVGMQVSHGCVRLYPEDIERLFPRVPIGTPGGVSYPVVKIGRANGAVWAQGAEGMYGKDPAIFRTATSIVQAQGIESSVDQQLLADGLVAAGGVPFQISPGVQGASLQSYAAR